MTRPVSFFCRVTILLELCRENWQGGYIYYIPHWARVPLISAAIGLCKKLSSFHLAEHKFVSPNIIRDTFSESALSIWLVSSMIPSSCEWLLFCPCYAHSAMHPQSKFITCILFSIIICVLTIDVHVQFNIKHSIFLISKKYSCLRDLNKIHT